MNFAVLNYGPPLSKEEKRLGMKLVNYDLPGIPHAITRRKLNQVDIEFEKKKKQLVSLLPLLTNDDISIQRYPYHTILLNHLKKEGHSKAAAELQMILRKEVYEVQRHLLEEQNRIIHQNDMLKSIADSVKYSWDLIDQGQTMMAITIRTTMAEHLLKTCEHKIWLSKHLYRTCLDLTVRLKNAIIRKKCQSETKCILAYLEQAKFDNYDAAMTQVTTLLQEAREESNNETWVFQSKILVIKLQRPISFLGLRQEFEEINCHSLSIFHVATLLQYEMFMSRVCKLILPFEKMTDPLNETCFFKASELVKEALALAKEINQQTAMSTAYTVIGLIHKSLKDFEKASEVFSTLQKYSNFLRDHETEAVSFHLLGGCYVEVNNSLQALEMFACQREIAEMYQLLDLEADALQNIGIICLEEGHTLESQLCYMEAYEKLMKQDLPLSDLNHLLSNTWAMKGVVAGLNFWPRFSSHCRLGKTNNLEQLVRWKMNRNDLKSLPNPNHHIPTITDTFNMFQDSSFSNILMRTHEENIVTSLVQSNKKLLPSDNFSLPMISDTSVQVSIQQDSQLDQGKGVHFSVEHDLLKTTHQKDLTEEQKLTICDYGLLLAYDSKDNYFIDEDSEVAYESDFINAEMRVPTVHLEEDGTNLSKSDKTMLMRILGHRASGKISREDLLTRPSLAFKISSLARKLLSKHESHSQVNTADQSIVVTEDTENENHSSHSQAVKAEIELSSVTEPLESEHQLDDTNKLNVEDKKKHSNIIPRPADRHHLLTKSMMDGSQIMPAQTTTRTKTTTKTVNTS